MGGSNQQTMGNQPKSFPNPLPDGSPPKDHRIRIHDSGGETHLHDDCCGKKVAIPNAEFWKRWHALKSDPFGNPLTITDSKNRTIATITPIVTQDGLDARIEISSIKDLKFIGNFSAIDKHVTAQGG